MGKGKRRKLFWYYLGKSSSHLISFGLEVRFSNKCLNFGNFRLDRQDIHFREINCIQKLVAVSACQRKTDFIQLPRYSEIES